MVSSDTPSMSGPVQIRRCRLSAGRLSVARCLPGAGPTHLGRGKHKEAAEAKDSGSLSALDRKKLDKSPAVEQASVATT
jgi:hypothetical protein